jgi:hypothetical protein
MEGVRETKDRLYSEDKKTGKASGVMKDVTGQLKSLEEQTSYAEKSWKQSEAPSWLWGESVCVGVGGREPMPHKVSW